MRRFGTAFYRSLKNAASRRLCRKQTARRFIPQRDFEAARFAYAFFLLATVFFLPLRVRAFVRVRCPRTGSPRL